MKFSDEEHVENLVRHIQLVHEAGLLLARRLMKLGQKTPARLLLSRIFQHDVSKFYGIEWDYLHCGPDVDKTMLLLAVGQHQLTNAHHPEYHSGIGNMGDLDLAEMVCDWYARSQEMGTNLRDWIRDVAIEKFKIPTTVLVDINYYVDLLLQSPFA